MRDHRRSRIQGGEGGSQIGCRIDALGLRSVLRCQAEGPSKNDDQIRLPRCDRTIRTRDAAAGHVGKCSDCDARVRVPVQQASFPTTRESSAKGQSRTKCDARGLPRGVRCILRMAGCVLSVLLAHRGLPHRSYGVERSHNFSPRSTESTTLSDLPTPATAIHHPPAQSPRVRHRIQALNSDDGWLRFYRGKGTCAVLQR